jgi:hypothetical protein
LSPDTGLHRYYGYLESVIRKIALRLKLLLALESLLRLASLFLIVLLGSLFLHGTQEIFSYLPFVYCLLALISLLVVFLMGLWKIASRRSTLRVARGFEEKFPWLRDDLTNSVLLYHQISGSSANDHISGELVTAQLRKTAAMVSKIHPKQVVNFRSALPHLKLLIPLLFAFTVVFALQPSFPGRSLAFIFDPRSALPMRETVISVDPAPSIVLRETPVVIKARATGYIPDRVSLRFWPDNGEVVHFAMDSEGNGSFSHKIHAAQSSFRYQAFSDRADSLLYEVRVVDAPNIGKMKLTLIPPGYTRLPEEIKEEGHIEALKGTVVNLEAWATKEVREGKLILDHKNQLPLNVEGFRLSGNLYVFNPGTYSLSIKDELGLENANPVQYRIHLIPDQYPQGEIISPIEDLEVTGNEILPLIYTASDDYGLTAIRLIYQMAGTERSITLKGIKDDRSAGLERFKWDLGSLTLTPGDRVTYRLEVWDNDSVSGPKAGYSRTLSLRMRNERDLAARESERAQEIADALLDLLADQLEDIKDRKALAAETVSIMEKVDQHLESMGTEKMERFDMESLKRNLSTLHRRIDRLSKESTTQELERLALLAENIANKTRMHEVEAVAREIRNRQRRLLEALREHKGPLTPEARQAMLQELEKLKDLVAQVMEAMSKMAAQLPDEFINSPELSGLEFQDFFKDLEEIQKKLMAGDMAGAIEAARRLMQNLSEMMAAMARAGAQANMGASGRLQSEMSRQAGELEKILAEQKEILAGTEAVDRELKHAIEAETEKRLEHMMSRFHELFKQLRGLLTSEERDSISEMERLLEAGQIERLSQLVESLEKALAGKPDVRMIFDQLMQQTKALIPDQNEVMTAESQERFPGLSSRQKELRERTAGLGEKLEMLSQLFPGMDTEIINDLRQGARSMGTASGELDGEDAGGAIPPEQEAIRNLTRSQQAMQQMAQQMARQMAMHMQGNRWAYPGGYDPRSGWYYGPRIPMPTLPQPDVSRPRERGYTGIEREEFDPPSKDAYKAPQMLREKVMEALKEDIPSRYRREVEQYFRGLTQ